MRRILARSSRYARIKSIVPAFARPLDPAPDGHHSNDACEEVAAAPGPGPCREHGCRRSPSGCETARLPGDRCCLCRRTHRQACPDWRRIGPVPCAAAGAIETRASTALYSAQRAPFSMGSSCVGPQADLAVCATPYNKTPYTSTLSASASTGALDRRLRLRGPDDTRGGERSGNGRVPPLGRPLGLP